MESAESLSSEADPLSDEDDAAVSKEAKVIEVSKSSAKSTAIGSALAQRTTADNDGNSGVSFKQWATARSTSKPTPIKTPLPIIREEPQPLTRSTWDEADEATARPHQDEDSDNDVVDEDDIGDDEVIPKTVHVTVDRSDETQIARAELPIIGDETSIMDLVRRNLVVILCGETGSGKTTQVPQFLYEAGWGSADPAADNPGMIGITQPRRVAAMSMAKRVGKEMQLGPDVVSYQIRYDATVSAATKIKFMTDGVLLREMSKDFLLSRYSCIIIDEAHDRTINTDLLLGLLSRVVALRRKLHFEDPAKVKLLRLIVMSATLRVSDFSENGRLFQIPPPVKSVEGRRFDVAIHFNRTTPEDHVADAYKKICKIHARLPNGGILVFMTSKNDIARLCNKLQMKYGTLGKPQRGQRHALPAMSNSKPSLQEDHDAEDMALGETQADDADNEDDEHALSDDSELSGEENEVLDEGEVDTPMLVLPLYSQLPVAQQQRIFEEPPPGTRMCIVATNVAETSLTIPGIRYVVDCGKVKERVYDPTTGIQGFQVNWISKASAEQRAGRAGRTQSGHCYRLYSSAIFDSSFEEYPVPEIMRTSIEGIVLQMKSMNIDRISNFPFPTSPDRMALAKAEKSLKSLGGLSEGGVITAMGKTMAVFPVSPRFAKMLILSQQYDCVSYIVALVAAFSVGELFISDGNVELEDGVDAEAKSYMRVQKAFAALDPSSDVFRILAALGAYEYETDKERFCARNYLRAKGMHEVSQLRQQIINMMAVYTDIDEKALLSSRLLPPSDKQRLVIRQIVSASFIDQVAMRANVLNKTSERTHEKLVLYKCMSTTEEVSIHPTSGLQQKAPTIVVFQELRQSSRLWIKDITEVDIKWLWSLGKHLCSIARVLDQPPPKVHANGTTRDVHVIPLFRPFNMELPIVKVQQRKVGPRWVFD